MDALESVFRLIKRIQKPGDLMGKIKRKITSQQIYQVIRDYLPRDHSRHQSLDLYLAQFVHLLPDSASVLDLGCGEGESVSLFRALSEDLVWHGVDIEDSPEVRKRNTSQEKISSFNGIDLPYPDGYFDLIFCRQVLEHVRHPDALIVDALRVLKPGGLFVGSVAYLEPYHSYSIFNFTPYGLVRVFGDAGFELKEIRPETDAVMLMIRQMSDRAKVLRPIWGWNFLYGFLGLAGRILRLGYQELNFLKVQFSGHLVFYARRPEEQKITAAQ